MKLHFSTDWLRRKPSESDEPEGCKGCGAIAGVCKDYPNCPGNSEWRDTNPTDKGAK